MQTISFEGSGRISAISSDGFLQSWITRVAAGVLRVVFKMNRNSESALLISTPADPQKYLPQYGGYCAYAMSINRIADISPTEWTIFGGKLYLNNNFISQTLWSLDKGSR